MTKWIMVQTRKEGIHFWKDAPQEVDFLKYYHRHEFHFRLSIIVRHDDRELEFILVKRWLDSVLPERDWGPKSCEMVGKEILDLAVEKWGKNRAYTIEVLEDGENGAAVSYP